MYRMLAFSSEPFGEFGESLPLSRVHVNVFPMTDVLIIHNVIVNSLSPCKKTNTEMVLASNNQNTPLNNKTNTNQYNTDD